MLNGYAFRHHSCSERSVPIKSTGHEKSHFTVILATGIKMEIVVFKGKGTRLVKELGTDAQHCGSVQHQRMDE